MFLNKRQCDGVATLKLLRSVDMSRCPEIHHLRLNLASERAVEEIRRKIVAANLGASAMAGGVVLQIFARNGTLQSAYSISQTDWQLFSSAMFSWHWILRREIESIANLQELDHANDPAQRNFWRAVGNGCQL